MSARSMPAVFVDTNTKRNTKFFFVSAVVQVHPAVKSWLKWAKFEEDLGDIARSRSVYEQAMAYLGDEYSDETLYTAFGTY